MQGSCTKWIVFILLCCFTTISSARITGQIPDSHGRIVKASDLRNKWVIVNYWADWCSGCIEEIPELNRFYQNNRDQNVVILGVNYDQLPPAYLQQSIQQTGIEFPVLLEDPRLLWHLGEVSVLPTTFIVNPNGDVMRKIIGPNTEQSLLRAVQNTLVKNKTKKTSIG